MCYYSSSNHNSEPKGSSNFCSSRSHLFWHNLISGVTQRVSLTDQSEQSNGGVGQPTVSADGRLIAFDSAATNLVPNDTNDVLDVFVREEDFPAKSFRYTAEEVASDTTVVGSVEAETAVQ